MANFSKNRIDIEAVRTAAGGRWLEIISSLGNLPLDSLDTRREGPCPKCGGDTRFRVVDEAAGALFCNGCFSTKNGDGFAAVAWLLDCKFIEAVRKIAEHLGIELKSKNGKSAKSQKVSPDKDLEWQSWSTALVKHYLAKKPGITEAALLAAGARLAKYKGFSVIAFPIAGKSLDANQPVGWVLADCLGGTISKLDRTGKVTGQTKVKITYKSQAGLLGAGAVEKLKAGGEVEIVWKVEGLSDMLALMSIIPETLHSQHLVVSNSNGKNENPKWQADVLAANDVNVIHDADDPGQLGAARWAGAIATCQADDLSVKNVQLPFGIEKTKGRDLRDWIAEGNDYDALLALAEKSEVVEASESPLDEPHVDIPAAVTNGLEVDVDSPDGESKTKIVPIEMSDLLLGVSERTHGWPKRVGRSLFVMRGKTTSWFEKSPGLFGWLQNFGRVDWFEKTGFVKKVEFFEELRSSAEEFVAIENLPHCRRCRNTIMSLAKTSRRTAVLSISWLISFAHQRPSTGI